MTLIYSDKLSKDTLESVKEDYEEEAKQHRRILDKGMARYEGDLDRTEQALEHIEQKIHSITIDLREKEGEASK